jgi:hypothetical protein
METPPPDPAPPPERRYRLSLMILGALLALAAGVWGAAQLAPNSGAAPSPAAEGGLVIDTTAAEDGHIDPTKPLRCFVQGRYVGEMVLADCASRNGVATDALDVGLDQTGALVAADQMAPNLEPLPLPPAESGPDASAEAPEAPLIDLDSVASCQSYAGGRWRRPAGEMTLEACAQMLFNGRCERDGAAAYGRWGEHTLRLVAGRVEISDEANTFRMLAGQTEECTVEPIG